MATVFDEIDDKLRSWLLGQHVFFVGTAPLSGEGHVNVSPKGMAGTFGVLSPRRVAYLDYFGSGAETIAHLRENGRIVLMFCAFTGPPKILRLHGRGRVILREDSDFAALRAQLPKSQEKNLRSIIAIDVERIADSCGYAVPMLDYVADRDLLDRSAERRPDGYYDGYARARNATSIDGLSALC